MQIKQSSQWKTGYVHVKVSGTWKDVVVPYIKTNGTWKATWSYSYVTGSWSSCSTTCGTGTQTRSVTCKRNDGVSVADKFCTAYGLTKPSTSQSCTDSSGCVSYSWYTGPYGSCSTRCGTGTQSRTVYCERSDGTRVSDSYCSGSKPSTSRSCSSTSGCTYSWYTGSWGSYTWSQGTSQCGIGSRSRTVYCQRSDGTKMSDSYCSGSKPSTTIKEQVCGYCYVGYSVAQSKDWSESNYINAKLKQLKASGDNSWTYSTLRTAMIQASTSVFAHYAAFGYKEGVCAYKFCPCCVQNGFTWAYPC